MIAVAGQEDFSRRWGEIQPGLRRALAARLGNAADGDDAMQDAALVAWLRRDCYDDARSFGAWAFGIARRCRRSRRSSRSVPLEACAGRLAVEDGRAAEGEEWVEALLARLPAEDGDLLRRICLAGAAIGTVAAGMGMGARTAARRLRRALGRLRQAIRLEACAQAAVRPAT